MSLVAFKSNVISRWHWMAERKVRHLAARWKQCQDHWGGIEAFSAVASDLHSCWMLSSWIGKHWTYKTFQACRYRAEGREEQTCHWKWNKTLPTLLKTCAREVQLPPFFYFWIWMLILHSTICSVCTTTHALLKWLVLQGAAGEILPKLSKLLSSFCF